MVYIASYHKLSIYYLKLRQNHESSVDRQEGVTVVISKLSMSIKIKVNITVNKTAVSKLRIIGNLSSIGCFRITTD